MQIPEILTQDHATWKRARAVLIGFCIFHFIFAAGFNSFSAVFGNYNPASAGVPAAMNYVISKWYIRKKIKSGKEFDNIALYALAVTATVFASQFIGGTIIALLVRR